MFCVAYTFYCFVNVPDTDMFEYIIIIFILLWSFNEKIKYIAPQNNESHDKVVYVSETEDKSVCILLMKYSSLLKKMFKP